MRVAHTRRYYFRLWATQHLGRKSAESRSVACTPPASEEGIASPIH